MSSIIFLAFALFGPDRPLTFTDRSAQFLAPSWEGGRSVLRIADLNQDGHPDIVSVGDHGSPLIQSQLHGVSVWLGDGAGNFASHQVGDFGYGGVDVGDVNNDGIPDIAYGVHHNYSPTDLGNQVLEVALGDGSAMNWTPWDDGLGLQGQTWGMFGCALADFNNDGWLDLASNAFGCCDGIHAYLNSKDGSWAPVKTMLGGNSDMDIQSADFNNDGYLDFVTSHQNGTVWLGDGAGGFTKNDAGLPAGGILGRTGASAGDFDRDGRDDIAFCGTVGGVEVWRSTASGWMKTGAGLPTTTTYSRTTFADMNNDGHLDLAAFRSTTLEIYLGDSAGNWSLDSTLTVPASGQFSALAIGDVDHNGRPDVALVARKNTGTFSSKNFLNLWTENTPASGLSVRVTSPTPNRVWRAGTTLFVDWQSAGTGLVHVDVSKSGPNGPWETVAGFLPNRGRHQITVEPKWAGSNVYIRVSAEAGPAGAHDAVGPITVIGEFCYADCDASGSLDFFDFLCFQNAFAFGDPYADCDASGTLDFFDFLCFQNEFAAGCK